MLYFSKRLLFETIPLLLHFQTSKMAILVKPQPRLFKKCQKSKNMWRNVFWRKTEAVKGLAEQMRNFERQVYEARQETQETKERIC